MILNASAIVAEFCRPRDNEIVEKLLTPGFSRRQLTKMVFRHLASFSSAFSVPATHLISSIFPALVPVSLPVSPP